MASLPFRVLVTSDTPWCSGSHQLGSDVNGSVVLDEQALVGFAEARAVRDALNGWDDGRVVIRPVKEGGYELYPLRGAGVLHQMRVVTHEYPLRFANSTYITIGPMELHIEVV